jgi:hypothetical protein
MLIEMRKQHPLSGAKRYQSTSLAQRTPAPASRVALSMIEVSPRRAAAY